MSHRLIIWRRRTYCCELACSARREAVARKARSAWIFASACAGVQCHHGGDGWEMGKATPPLRGYFRAHPPAAATVPGGRLWLRSRSDPAWWKSVIHRRVIGMVSTWRLRWLRSPSRLAAQKGVSGSRFFAQQDLFAWLPRTQRVRKLRRSSSTTVSAPSNRSIAMTMAAAAQLLRPGDGCRSVLSLIDYPGGPFMFDGWRNQRRFQDAFSITYQETPTTLRSLRRS